MIPDRQTLESYHKARQLFAQSIADFSQRSANCHLLIPTLPLLAPLIQPFNTDNSQSGINANYTASNFITEQHLASLALSRIAAAGFAEDIAKCGLLPILVSALDQKCSANKQPLATSSSLEVCNQGDQSIRETYQGRLSGRVRAAACAIRNIAKNSFDLSKQLVAHGAMSKLCRLLDDFEPSVKEIGALALASIVKHHPSLACDLVKLGALPQLIQSIQEPELAIKAASSQCIAEIVSHSTEMAHVAVDCGAILVLSKCLELNDPRPKRSALNALACIAKHSVDLAESIVSAEIYPSAMLLLRDVDEIVRRNTMILTKEICKQSQDLAQLMTSIGVIGATLSYLKGSPLSTGSIAESQNSLQCHAQIPALLTLGYLAAQSDTISLCLIRDKVVELLDQVLRDTKDSKLLCTAIWTLSQICQHSAEHSKSIASIPGAFENILSFVSPNSADKSELSEKAARCLRLIIQKCTYLPALEPLLVITASRPHSEILASILVQFSKVLPVEAVYRKSFVTSGCLKVIQEMQVVGSGDDAGSGLAESVVRINECFPPEIVKYYSPGYSEVLLERVDQFTIN